MSLSPDATLNHPLWPYKDEKPLYCHVCGKPIEDCNWDYIDGWEVHNACCEIQE